MRAKRRISRSTQATTGTRKSNRPRSTWSEQRRQALAKAGLKEFPFWRPASLAQQGIKKPSKYQRISPQMKKEITQKGTEKWINGKWITVGEQSRKYVTRWNVKKLSRRAGTRKTKMGTGRKSMAGAGPSGGKKARGKGKQRKQATKGMRGGGKKRKRKAKRAKQ